MARCVRRDYVCGLSHKDIEFVYVTVSVSSLSEKDRSIRLSSRSISLGKLIM